MKRLNSVLSLVIKLESGQHINRVSQLLHSVIPKTFQIGHLFISAQLGSGMLTSWQLHLSQVWLQQHPQV